MNTKPFPFGRYNSPFMPDNPSKPEGFVQGWETTLSMIDTLGRPSELFAGMCEHIHIAYHLAYGTVVHVPSQLLLDACARSTFSPALCMNDFPLSPYPAYEFRPPANSKYQPLLLLNLGSPHYQRYYRCTGAPGHLTNVAEQEGHWMAYIPTPSTERAFVYAINLPPTHSILQADTSKAYSYDGSLKANLTAYLLAMLQAKHRMESLPPSRDNLPGLPGRTARVARNRNHVSIPPPLFQRARNEHVNAGSTHTGYKVRGHMRAAHFRTLNHSRFKRDADGHPRIIFVDVCEVGGNVTRKERRI